MPQQINISSLDFQDIKTSLQNYLNSDQSLFKSYPFTGSALSTVLDVLAYNTLYYGFYANMIANETFLDTAQLQSNITALLKPLGYIVNGMNASKLVINATGINLIAYQTVFSATSGTSTFNFYPIKTYNLVGNFSQEIELYEAASVISIDNINSADLVNNQSYFINDKDIDINTITVTVDGEMWERYTPNTSFYKSNKKIYFIDRTDEGFYILFSKYNTTDISGLYGNQIKSTQTVKLQYIKPTGEDANNAVLIPRTSVVALRPSGGGGRPDLDIIKTFVPKLFSSAGRAITKDDYYGLLYEQAYSKGLITTLNQLSVWGGDELVPPIYGRIFYSFNDPGLTGGAVKDITLALKEKGMMTVDLEYVPSINLNINANLKYSGSANQISLLNSINTIFSTPEFNKTFSIVELITQLRNTFSSSALTSLSVNDLKIIVPFNYTDSTIKINVPVNGILSSTFSYDTYSDAYFKNVGNTINLYSGTVLIKENVGYLSSNGVISIQNDIISSSIGSIILTLTPTDKNAPIITNNQYILSVNTTLSKI